MEQKVKVIACRGDGMAQVMVVRQSACSGDCHKCSGCGAVEQKVLLTARNPIGAKPGDLVTIASASGPVLKGAAILYLLPLVLFIGCYLPGMQWRLGGLTGLAGFLLGLAIAMVYDRKVVKKTNTEYTIIGHCRTQPQAE